MQKNIKIIVVITIAIIAMLVAGVLTFMFLSPTKTKVYSFNDNYTAGTKITSNMLVPVEIDARATIAGSNQDVSDYFITIDTYNDILQTEDTLKTDVSKGTILTSSMLTVDGGIAIEKRMDPSKIAVSVPVDNISGVTYDLDVDTYCNLYATYSQSGTFALLENMRVIDVAKEGNNLTSVTFEGTNEEVKKIIDAVNSGTIRLGIVNHDSYNKNAKKDVSKDKTAEENTSNNTNTSTDKYDPDNYTAATSPKDK